MWGQDSAVAELQRALQVGPGHSYVIGGQQMTGKNAIATTFAQALSCAASAEPGVPCGACSRCRRVQRGTFPDVTRFSLASQAARETGTSKNQSLTIATVREIAGSIALRPLESDWRVVIVDDVETMQETAQEAFLKTLEEPPPYVVIILLTADVDLLLPTIRSRCVSIRMQIVPRPTIVEALRQSEVDERSVEAIADVADGLVGWAFRAASDQDLLAERLMSIEEAQSWIESDKYGRLVTATLLADRFAKDRDAVFARLLTAQRQWRNRMIADPHSGEVVRALRAIDRAIMHLEANVRPKLALQQMVLAWPPTP